MNLLEAVGMREQKDKYPDRISGGKKQRVAVARALVTNPELALAKSAESAASTAVRLPVSISLGLTTSALALSLRAGALASYFMGRRTARMKPADILRKL